MLCPAALALKRPCPGAFLFPFPFSVALLHGGQGGILRRPRDGAQSWGTMPGDTFRDTKDSRILHCVGGSFSSLLLSHLVSLGVFFCPAESLLGVGLEGSFFAVFQPQSGIGESPSWL